MATFIFRNRAFINPPAVDMVTVLMRLGFKIDAEPGLIVKADDPVTERLIDQLIERMQDDLLVKLPDPQPAAPIQASNLFGLDLPLTTSPTWLEPVEVPMSEEQPAAVEQPAKKPKRGRKPRAEQPVVAALPEHPECKACGKTFIPNRKSQIYCKDPWCEIERRRKAAAEKYVKMHPRTEKAPKPESQPAKRRGRPRKEEPAATILPTDADLHAAEKLELEIAAEELPAAAELPFAELAQIAVGELAAADLEARAETASQEPSVEADLDIAQSSDGEDPRAHVWTVEDGPRAGTRMSTSTLKALLNQGNLRSGQHLRHEQRGRHEVVKIPGKSIQRLKKLYGQDAGQIVALSAD